MAEAVSTPDNAHQYSAERVDAMRKVIAATDGGVATLREMLEADRRAAGLAGELRAKAQLTEMLDLLDHCERTPANG